MFSFPLFPNLATYGSFKTKYIIAAGSENGWGGGNKKKINAMLNKENRFGYFLRLRYILSYMSLNLTFLEYIRYALQQEYCD